MDKELTSIKKAKRAAAKKAKALNKALGIETVTLKDDKIVRVDSEGNETTLSKSTFGYMKVSKRKYVFRGTK
ncbi:MAG TPA: hypothetical protein PK047_01520 [Saprospiraceae bacterium]|jgi:hypothetical protein|nr:hypothetical protein [Saprospiraceae bacterium]HRP40798.1 hypothetical protein [Saprospiraceae bacterium]